MKQIIKSRKFDNDLRKIWSLMARLYKGNHAHRFSKTPYMAEANKEEKKESILGHQWSMSMLWLLLEKTCPNLAGAIDPAKAHFLCLTHDIGETIDGDIPITCQLANPKTNKIAKERKKLKALCAKLPANLRTMILAGFDAFETKPTDIDDPTVLTAKMLDTLQGNHYVMAFGTDLAKNSELINKAINKHLGATYRQLLKILSERGEKEACREVNRIMDRHLKDWKKLGVKIVLE